MAGLRYYTAFLVTFLCNCSLVLDYLITGQLCSNQWSPFKMGIQKNETDAIDLGNIT